MQTITLKVTKEEEKIIRDLITMRRSPQSRATARRCNARIKQWERESKAKLRAAA